MRIKCPHCSAVADFDRFTIGVFVSCPRCRRDFRPAASSPVMAGDFTRPNPGTTAEPRGGYSTFDGSGSREWERLTREGMRYFQVRMYDQAEKALTESLSLKQDQPEAVRVLQRIRAMAQASH